MKKILISFLLIAIILLVSFIFLKKISQTKTSQVKQEEAGFIQGNNSQGPIVPKEFISPLEKAQQRVTKKPFGIFIVPKNSPVQPEKFSGYHTGTDFEIFPEELGVDVPVRAVCSGKLRLKKIASGYGGLAIEDCFIEKNPITVIYGHLKLESIKYEAGAELKAGDMIGVLGKDRSQENNWERKHLHLGFHMGGAANILGYVKNRNDLLEWIDPCRYVCRD